MKRTQNRPACLFTRWNEKHGGDAEADYEQENKDQMLKLVYLMITLASIVVMGLPVMPRIKAMGWSANTSISVFWSGFALFLGSIFLIIRGGVPTNKNGHNCVAAIDHLLASFHIAHGPEIRDISPESFRSEVELMLLAHGTISTFAEFDRTGWKHKFEALHAEAREWDLCHETYDRYFLQKDGGRALGGHFVGGPKRTLIWVEK